MPERARPGPDLALHGAALILALGLLVGRWSPARLFDIDPVPVYLEVRWVLVFGAVAILAMRQRPVLLPSPWTLALISALTLFAATAVYAPITVDETYLVTKIADILFLAFFCWFAAVAADDPDFERVFWVYVLGLLTIIFAIAASTILSGGAGATATTNEQRLSVLGGGPNVLSRLLGMLAILTLARALAPGRLQLGWLGYCLFTLFLITLTGSRGGSTAAVAGILFLLAHSVNRRNLLLMAALPIIGFLTYPLWEEALTRYLPFLHDRYWSLLVDRLYYSGRDVYYAFSVRLFTEHPLFGAGLAGFSGNFEHNYPHNLILELLGEGGLVWALAILVPLAGLVAATVRHWRFMDQRTMAALVVYGVASQFSGDLFDSRPIFFFAIIMAAGAARRAAEARGRGLAGAAGSSPVVGPAPLRPPIRPSIVRDRIS